LSSKTFKLYALLSSYNSFMWDIVRAYKESGISERDLVTYLVENDINLSSKTIIRYKALYDKLKILNYSDSTIDKKTPNQWLEYYKLKELK